ncbi:RepA replication protein [Novosphingobium sp. AAP1]|nr:RepA replication protein [Novosphingobium sp. AAP1]
MSALSAASARTKPSTREEPDLFVPRRGPIAPRDAQDLMVWPFFSLAKNHRIRPIDFRMGDVAIRVEATHEHGMATIWDADVLIWIASQIVEARDAGRPTSRIIAARPHDILTFTRRGTGKASYARLKAALGRLQSTMIATTLRQPERGRRQCFSWIDAWRECSDARGRACGIELIVSEWFYQGILQPQWVLTIDRAYFGLTGGLERWLYRLVRKHGGRQAGGWTFDLPHLHMRSGLLWPLKRFAFALRGIVSRQALPGYTLTLFAEHGRHWLRFVRSPEDRYATALRRVGLAPVDKSS